MNECNKLYTPTPLDNFLTNAVLGHGVSFRDPSLEAGEREAEKREGREKEGRELSKCLTATYSAGVLGHAIADILMFSLACHRNLMDPEDVKAFHRIANLAEKERLV